MHKRKFNFESDKEFKAYLRANKLTMSQFFNEVDPKFDLYSGERIVFKNREQFESDDFVSKENMSKWLSEVGEKQAKKYICQKIQDRASKKDFKFFPSQVEARASKEVPALNIIQKHCNIPKLSKYLGLQCRYDYEHTPTFDASDLVIGIDSREQMPLEFSSRVEVVQTKFDFGDYSYMGDSFNNIFIERKSIQDLWGTMSQGYERFNREIDRSQAQGSYLIVVVDYPFGKAISYNKNKKFSKATSQYIFHQIGTILQKYDNIQFVFSGGRSRSSDLIEKIGSIGADVRKLDLQFLLDTGGLK